MSEENGSYKKVMVSRADAFRASKWLKKNRQELAARNLTRDQIAEELARALGVPVSVGNLTGICEDFDVEPMWRKHVRDGQPKLLERGQLSRLTAFQLVCIARELERLYGILGETFNPDGKIRIELLSQAAHGHVAVESPEVAEASGPAEVKPISE